MLGFNRQVYYRRKKTIKEKQEKAIQVLDLVNEKRQLMPRLGTKKLYHLLKEELQKMHIGRDKLFDILRANHQLIKPKRSYHKTTNSHHHFKKHKDLTIDLQATRPEELWVSDITYLGKRENHLYLALVTDVYSKKIVGYDLSTSLAADGAIRALKKGLKKRKYKSKELIHHSDRGVQYCCTDYQKAIKEGRLRCSMTESYDPYRNAVAERVNGILKQEFLLEEYQYPLPIMKKLVANSIEIYNNHRPHLSCNMKTPQQMHKQKEIKIKTYKSKKSPQK